MSSKRPQPEPPIKRSSGCVSDTVEVQIAGAGREAEPLATAGRHHGAVPISRSSSSSWMMIRGVTMSIRLWVSRPMPTLRNKRLT